jgi:hypothetical protein
MSDYKYALELLDLDPELQEYLKQFSKIFTNSSIKKVEAYHRLAMILFALGDIPKSKKICSYFDGCVYEEPKSWIWVQPILMLRLYLARLENDFETVEKVEIGVFSILDAFEGAIKELRIRKLNELTQGELLRVSQEELESHRVSGDAIFLAYCLSAAYHSLPALAFAKAPKEILEECQR